MLPELENKFEVLF